MGVSMDSMASIYHPLTVKDPFLLVFFLPFILVVSISLMNLVTAVIVQGALEQGNQDREAQGRYKQHRLKQMLPGLRDLFKALDANGDGTVTLEELEDSPAELKQKLEEFMQADSVAELFEMVDVDDSGEVDIDEFCDGIARVVTANTSVENIRMLKQMSITRRELHDLEGRIVDLESMMKLNLRILKEIRGTEHKQEMMMLVSCDSR